MPDAYQDGKAEDAQGGMKPGQYEIEPFDRKTYLVRPRPEIAYIVDLEEVPPTCTCEDWTHRGPKKCKHIRMVLEKNSKVEN